MKIAGYLIREKLSRGKNFTVYRAIKETGTLPCILKMLEKKTARNFNVINSIKQEYGFLKQIDSQYVVKALGRIDHKDFAGIVLEDIGGIPLKEEITGTGFPVEQFIPLAMQITEGLAAVHRQNIIHKDINPTNIIRSVETGSLKIIDFNIASTFDIKVSHPGNPDRLEGTLPYISPEQTGRMNRRVDQRSDLYSLGVTFYQMLTGKLPFEHRDPMEIIYAHMARDPDPPHLIAEHVPEIVSKIVLKLLAKNPGERYQSVEGLNHDLKKLLNLNRAYFKLGEKDFSGKLQIPEKLYGREKEVEQLLAAYQRVSTGKKEIIMVTGYPGTGKTALVNEIHTPITRDRGCFISGKFEQLQRTIPYFAFIQAINQFCQLLLTEKQEVLTRWKDRILQAVGNLAKVLTDIFPQLAAVIGKQPEVPAVGGEDAKKRFNYVFQCFLRAISTEEHPLVLFLDDLQWADLASLDLIRVLVEDTQNSYLLFIGAYRDNEVSPVHPLMTIMEEIQNECGEIPIIPVKNLSVRHVRQWLQDTLTAVSSRDVMDLAGLVYQKTRGNAFFTIQFLENLYREHLLSFDFNRTGWTWDITDIEKQNITDNVVDLLAHKIRLLQAEVQEVLKLAACIGNVFHLPALSVISQEDKEVLIRNLEISLKEHLVYPLEDEAYKFGHDRIHQAAYILINEKDKKPLHLKIGRLLLENFGISDTSNISKEAEKYIFDIVNHLNIGIELIENPQEKIDLARLNLKAGQNARAAAAYRTGADYIQTAVGLLPDDCWQRHYDLTLAIHNEALQTFYLCGNYKEMDDCIETVLIFAREISHKAVAYEYRILGLVAQSQEHRATETLLTIFSTLGVNIPAGPGELKAREIVLKTQDRLKQKGTASLKDLPRMNEPKNQLVLRLYYIGAAAIALAAPELLPLITCKMIDLILEYGLTPEVPFVLIWHGVVRSKMGDFSGAYQLGEVALDLLDKETGHEAIKARSVFMAANYLIGFKQHFKKVCKLIIDNYPHALNVGDIEYSSYYLTSYIQLCTETDTELSIIKEKGDNLLDQVIKINARQAVIVGMTAVQSLYAANLLGKSSNPAFLDLSSLRDLEKNMQENVKLFYTFKVNFKTILLKYFFEEYDGLIDYIKAAEDCFKQSALNPTSDQSFFNFIVSLAYLQLCTRDESKKHKEEYLGKVEKAAEILGQWAEFGPVNFLHKYYLMQAELYRVKGKNNQAAEYYDKAIEKAYENEYVNEAAIANELAAKFYMHNNRHKLAALYFMEARDCYRKWGAIAKVKHLEENYPKYVSTGIPGSKLLSTGTISSASTDTTGELLDVKSIIKASQTLSGEVQFARLLEKMMRILVENAGAQKSMLIENIDHRLLVQAEGTTDGVSGILQRQPVEESEKVPLSVINYVAHSEKKLVFDNISKDPNYSSDPYIQKHQSKSVVCFPVIRKDELSAIIYLENNLVEGAFTPARLEVLNTLSSQIAISMENARIYRDLRNLNKSLEQKVAERTRQLEEMDKIKSRFFANISHEFRTPLTLIMGPLEQKLSGSRDKRQQEELRMMLRNSQRLLTLINQLLDLSKLESGNMKLHTSQQNIISFLKGVVGSFASLALQKKLDLTFQVQQENINFYFDAEKLEKVMTNLIANAMKFTPAGGKINVTVKDFFTSGGQGGSFRENHPPGPPAKAFVSPGTNHYTEGYLEIKVCDTGIGIPADRLPYVFDRFYQAGSSTDRERRGTGIGLALVKELVELHNGEVSVQSTENKGSKFTIRLPLTAAFGDQGALFEKTRRDSVWPPAKTFDYEDDEHEADENQGKTGESGMTEKNVILVVEDNPDMRKYIRGPLQADYTVVEAANGREGVQKAREIIPDLIVSDIMMPEMDGYQLCDALKKDVDTSHIPIVLLTAKASTESIIAGLETGADDYITKPFNTKILLTRIKNLIDLRRQLQEKIQREMTLQPTEIAVSSVDQEFMQELKAAIEKNISDEQFGVDELANALYMSRATLNRKIRALTGESTNQFIQSYRLNRAAQLLKANFGNVTDVAFEVGFSTSAYFTKCFKEKFHQLPHTFQAAETGKQFNPHSRSIG